MARVRGRVSARCVASSSTWRAARSGRSRLASARTCRRSPRGPRRPCSPSPVRPPVRALSDSDSFGRVAAPNPKVRLVLGQPPMRPSLDRLAMAYLGTAWTLGREATSLLPIDALADPSLRAPWSWQAVTVGRALAAVEPSMARDGRVVQLVDGGAEALAAVAIGAASAGYRVVVARQSDPDDAGAGVIEMVPPGAAVPPGPRRGATSRCHTHRAAPATRTSSRARASSPRPSASTSDRSRHRMRRRSCPRPRSRPSAPAVNRLGWNGSSARSSSGSTGRATSGGSRPGLAERPEPADA
jgi:hypothetical protein